MTPPQHSVTASIVFLMDQAFDWTNVGAERALMPDSGNDHPLVAYCAGTTRFDLDALCPVARVAADGSAELGHARARDYLKPNHGCREWRLRRLRSYEVAQCRDRGGKVGQLAAFALAAGDGKPLTDAQVDALVDTYGMAEVVEVGEAALRASESPKAAEKKL